MVLQTATSILYATTNFAKSSFNRKGAEHLVLTPLIKTCHNSFRQVQQAVASRLHSFAPSKRLDPEEALTHLLLSPSHATRSRKQSTANSATLHRQHCQSGKPSEQSYLARTCALPHPLLASSHATRRSRCDSTTAAPPVR